MNVTRLHKFQMRQLSFVFSSQNHSMRLTIFNSYSPLKLLAVVETRFASIIIMLKRLFQVKQNLRNMVISEKWMSYREDDVEKVQTVRDYVLNDL